MGDEATSTSVPATNVAVLRKRKEPAPQWRIPTHTAIFMILVAFFVFDGAQLASSAIGMAGGFAMGAAYAAPILMNPLVQAGVAVTDVLDWLFGWIPSPSVEVADNLTIRPTECLTVVKCIIGNGIQWVVGTTIDGAVEMGVRLIMLFFFLVKIIISWTFLLLGFLTMWLWLTLRGVSIFAGNMIGRKAAATFGLLIVGIIPFISDIPDMTLWISIIILFSWHEDKERHDKLLTRHRTEDARLLRVQRAHNAHLS